MRQCVQPGNQQLILLVASPGFVKPAQQDETPADQDQCKHAPDDDEVKVETVIEPPASNQQGDPERKFKGEQPLGVKVERRQTGE